MSLEGLDKLLRELDKAPKEVRKIVEDVTSANALEIERTAKRKAPIDTGDLRQSSYTLDTGQGKNIESTIGFSAKHAPYMEFGTGGRVRVPEELKDLAIKFKGKGVREVNIRPQPFLYPALIRQTIPYLKDLEDSLTPYFKKI